MNQARQKLSHTWEHIQGFLFPMIRRELGELTHKQKQLVSVLELIRLEEHMPYSGGYPGRPEKSRIAIARAFVTKMVYDINTTRMLQERLNSDPTIRRICGWERRAEVPSEATFSRAFAEFSKNHLPERIHQAMIEEHLGDQIIGHISRDSTAIHAREKPEPKTSTAPTKAKKLGRPKKGEERVKEPTRLERQATTLTLSDMLKDLPKNCNVGTKKNSKGYKSSWVGYKLHIDAADGGIPISCLLTSASLHDSQAAIPLAEITHKRVTSLYDLMDAAYDAPQIKAHSHSLGHTPIIDPNPRSKKNKAEQKDEAKRRRIAGYRQAEDQRYNERSTVERVNGRIKDEFGARNIRVRGNAKVMAHLMFGITVLTAIQLMKFIE